MMMMIVYLEQYAKRQAAPSAITSWADCWNTTEISRLVLLKVESKTMTILM